MRYEDETFFFVQNLLYKKEEKLDSPRLSSPSKEKASLDSLFVRSPETSIKAGNASKLDSKHPVILSVLNFNGETVALSFYSEDVDESKKVKDLLAGKEPITVGGALKFSPLPGNCYYLRTFLRT